MALYNNYDFFSKEDLHNVYFIHNNSYCMYVYIIVIVPVTC